MEGLGRIPVSINGVTAAGVTDVSFDQNQNQNLRVTADQQTVRTAGKGKYKFSLDGVLLRERVLVDPLLPSPRGLQWLTRHGPPEHILLTCRLHSRHSASDSVTEQSAPRPQTPK